jgi:hypothetical protein
MTKWTLKFQPQPIQQLSYADPHVIDQWQTKELAGRVPEMLRRARKSDHSVLVMPRLADIVGRVGLHAAAEIVEPVETALTSSNRWVPDYRLVVDRSGNPALQLFARDTKCAAGEIAASNVDTAKKNLDRMVDRVLKPGGQDSGSHAEEVGILVQILGLPKAAEFMSSLEKSVANAGWDDRYEFSVRYSAPVLSWSVQRKDSTVADTD